MNKEWKRMKLKKAVIGILVAALFLPAAVPAAYAATGPGYRVEGNISRGQMNVSVSVSGGIVVGGRLAFSYDTAKLVLLNQEGNTAAEGSAVTSVVAGEKEIDVTKESNQDRDLVRVGEGSVMFAWSTAGNGGLDAEGGEKKLAELRFSLAPGVNAGDLTSDSLRVKSVQSGEVPGWNSAATLLTGDGENGILTYTYEGRGSGVCGVRIDYPGSDKEPIYMRTVKMKVTDQKGASLSGATIQVDGKETSLPSSGVAQLRLIDGDYAVLVGAKGYETKELPLSVKGNQEKTVALRTEQELCQDVARNLKIIYAKGDNEAAVSTHLELPKNGESSTRVSWKSNHTNVINNNGAVVPASGSSRVTLVATVEKGGAKAQRSFVLTVPGYGTTAMLPNGQEETPLSGGRFRDLQGYEWAEEAILALADAGVVSGTGPDTYSPESPIKRGDYLLMLSRVLDMEAAASAQKQAAGGRTVDGTFPDVPRTVYYAKAVEAAKVLGIAKGNSAGLYEPEHHISRQDLMVLSANALRLVRQTTFNDGSQGLLRFSDQDRISPYARPSVGGLVEAGLISGNKKGEICPLAPITRAEAAVFLYKMYGK